MPAPPEEQVLEGAEGWEQAGTCSSPALARGCPHGTEMSQNLLCARLEGKPSPRAGLAPGSGVLVARVFLGATGCHWVAAASIPTTRGTGAG